MKIINLIASLSNQRKYWFLLLLGCSFLISMALYFQYFLLQNPCSYCIKERIIVALISLVCFFVLINPNNIFIRTISLFGFFLVSLKGVFLVQEHLSYLKNTSLFKVCPAAPSYPSFLDLEKIAPFFFSATGACTEFLWSFLGIKMLDWLAIFFSFFLLISSSLLFCFIYKTIKK